MVQTIKWIQKTNLIIRWLVKRSSLIWTNWFAMRDNVVKMFPKYKSKVVTIPLGVERDLFENVSMQEIHRVRKQFSIKDSTYLMLYVRSFIPNSNQDKIIKALSHLDKGLNYKLILHNSRENPEYESYLYRLIDKYNLEDRVQISHSYLNNLELRALFKSANLSFSITRNEQFSRTVSETILSDTNLILSDIEPYRYLIRNFNFNVDLVDVTNIENFAGLLKKYIENPVIPDYTEEKKIIKDLFDFESKFDEFLDIYQNLINDANKN